MLTLFAHDACFSCGRVRVINVISGEVSTNILKSDVRDERELPEGSRA